MTTEEALETLVAHLRAGRRLEAVTMLRGLAADGVPIRRIVSDLLAPAQMRIGEAWREGQLDVADEHRATSIAQAALAAAAMAGIDQPPADGPRVVLACVQGDWHSLPSQMFGHSLEELGIAVTFLGPNVAPRNLARVLREQLPTALVLTASVPALLHGVVPAVQMASELGIPTVVGGSAASLIAPGWSGGDAGLTRPDEVAALVQRWWEAPPTDLPQTHPDEGYRLLADAADIVLGAMIRLQWSVTDDLPVDVRVDLRADLRSALDALASAVLLQSPDVLRHHLEWMTTQPSSGADHLRRASLVALAHAVDDQHPHLPVDLSGMVQDMVGSAPEQT